MLKSMINPDLSGKKIYFILVIVLLTSSMAFGDTILFEDFEGDVSDWTFGTSGQNNYWFCAWAVHHAGDKSAYITYDWGNTAGYDNIWSSTSYLTRTIDLTDYSSATLSFFWKCVGEPDYDYGEVWANEDRVSGKKEFFGQPDWAYKMD